ncbi:MAG: hypothetical protein IPM42_22120 [Saprospiraceae bacterium]|nr:hypothetical protein [Saprospiraceae bacterium]
MTTAIKKIPTYDELVSMDETKGKLNDLQVRLNQEPPAKWVKTNDLANKSKYLPIDKVEYLLTALFIKWWVEVKDFKVVANSCAVHVRLYYVDPITGETLFQDGVGAAPMQTDKGAGAVDFNHIKNAAVQMALPAAETYAIKDAAEKIGRIFGKDLNRKDLMAYDSLVGRFQEIKEDPATQRIMLLISKATSKTELEKLRPHLNKDVQELFDTKLAEVK